MTDVQYKVASAQPAPPSIDAELARVADQHKQVTDSLHDFALSQIEAIEGKLGSLKECLKIKRDATHGNTDQFVAAVRDILISARDLDERAEKLQGQVVKGVA